jgi:DNA-binding response OmpR family regulator
VIEDDLDARDLMRRFLAREGFDTLTAADASEGLRLARQFKPTLITLDVVMPRVDGWAVLRELKADPTPAGIPVGLFRHVYDTRVFTLVYVSTHSSA